MSLENSKTYYLHSVIVNLTDEMHLKRNDQYYNLSNLSIAYTWNNITTIYKNNKSKISKIFAPTWNDKFELSDEYILYQIYKVLLSIL